MKKVMVRRRKAKRRSSPRNFRLLKAVESYAYLSIMTENFLGSSPLSVLTSGSDIRTPVSSYTGSMTYANPDNQISLQEMIQSPGLAFQALNANVMSNWQNAALQTFFVGAGFKLGRNLLRKPIANVNANIFKPLTGRAGFRL